MAITYRHRSAPVTDISDYITGSADVPLYHWNRDISPVLPTFNIEVSKNVGVVFNRGDWIEVYIDGALRSFKIKTIVNDVDAHKYKIELISALEILKTKKLDRSSASTLISVLENTTDPVKYKYQDNYYDGSREYTNVQVMYLLELMFTTSGFEFVNSCGTRAVGTWNGDTYTYNEIAIDYNMMWCINQGVACRGTIIDGSADYEGSKITYWDFITKTFSLLGIVLKQLDLTRYALYSNFHLSNISINDSNRYSMKQEQKDNKGSFAVDVKHADRIEYYGNDPFSLDKNSNTEKYKSTSQWYNNLRFMLRSKAPGASAGDIVTPESNAFFDPMYKATMVKHNLRDSINRYYNDVDSRTNRDTNIFNTSQYKVKPETGKAIVKEMLI
jgi:hypothetical protein